ncbi:MAG: SPOR domain-containing protein [Betaproteobacteria bacterium]|nr:SPOR domain-containing protein [Betaproteobacteria bacterium]
MAATKTTEISAAELELKRRGRRRLIGAATLALLAIVFLPMVFDSEPKRDVQGQQAISIQLPDKDRLPPLPAPANPPPPASTQTPAAAPQSAGDTVASDKPVTTEPAKPAATEKTAPATKPAPAAKPTPAPKTAPAARAPAVGKAAFAVQIGAYRDADNAKLVVSKLKEQKLPVSVDTLAISGGKVTRVRVGPYADRAQADAALAEVKLAGLDGKIVPLKP